MTMRRHGRVPHDVGLPRINALKIITKMGNSAQLKDRRTIPLVLNRTDPGLRRHTHMGNGSELNYSFS